MTVRSLNMEIERLRARVAELESVLAKREAVTVPAPMDMCWSRSVTCLTAALPPRAAKPAGATP